MERINNRGKVMVKVEGDHRTGDGELITHLVSIVHPEKPPFVTPDAPTCLRCIPKYFLQLWISFIFFCLNYMTVFMYKATFAALLASYHSRRITYCESMRYVPDEVHGVFRIRRAGFLPGTNTLYPYKPEIYGTIQEAQKACRKIADKVLERYRTGEPSPKNLWQAIHANIKLKCPVCRKYNVDPLLFGGKKYVA